VTSALAQVYPIPLGDVDELAIATSANPPPF